MHFAFYQCADFLTNAVSYFNKIPQRRKSGNKNALISPSLSNLADGDSLKFVPPGLFMKLVTSGFLRAYTQ